MQTHEEHFQRAVEKGGLNRGLNTAVLPCTEPQEENEEKSKFDITPYLATACENMQEHANQENLHLIPPRGLEPLLPG